MPQFDVYRLANEMLVIDCQADPLTHLQSRFCVPLLPEGRVITISGLNPSVEVNGERMNLYPQGAATIPVAELNGPEASLGGERCRILNAIDVLLSGI